MGTFRHILSTYFLYFLRYKLSGYSHSVQIPLQITRTTPNTYQNWELEFIWELPERMVAIHFISSFRNVGRRLGNTERYFYVFFTFFFCVCVCGGGWGLKVETHTYTHHLPRLFVQGITVLRILVVCGSWGSRSSHGTHGVISALVCITLKIKISSMTEIIIRDSVITLWRQSKTFPLYFH